MFLMPRVGPCGGPLPTGEVLFMRPDGTHVDSLWFKLEGRQEGNRDGQKR